MLEIIIEGRPVELSSDTSISLTMEQPLTSTDKIPAAYTLSFDLPRSPRNCQLLGHPERITSLGSFAKRSVRIRLAGLEVAAGELSIEEVQEAITVQFVGARFPDNIRKPLYQLDFGKLELGSIDRPISNNGRYVYDTSAAGLAYNDLLKANLTDSAADMIAAPISIADAEYVQVEGATPEDPYVNQRRFFINAFWANNDIVPGRGYLMYSSRAGRISKILPAFRVGWMFEHLFGSGCRNNVFWEEWQQLVLVSLWHPKYQIKDNTPVWDLSNGQVSIRLADFMPNVPANEFVAEMLKIACASLYVRNGEYIIERNGDILGRSVYRDWNDKIIGTPTISIEAAQRYNFGYSSGNDEIPAERVITEIGSIQEMIAESERADSVLKTYHVTSTGQTFENVFDDTTVNRCRYMLLKQHLGAKQEEDETDETEEFDMVTNVSVLKTVPTRYIGRDNDPMANIDMNKIFYYVPQISEVPEKRPDNLTVALWKGMSQALVSGVPNMSMPYPYFSHCNYDAEGNKLDDVTLCLTGETLARHAAYKAWIEKDKMVVKAEVLLTPLDLHRLDLRDKFYLQGKYFFIRRLEITMTPERLEAAEVEFIET